MATSINFPSSPSVGQQYTYNTIVYEWTGSFWRVYNPSNPSTVSDTLPTGSFSNGFLWFNPLEARLYTYYNGVWMQFVRDGVNGANGTNGTNGVFSPDASFNTINVLGTSSVQQIFEKATISATAATGTINFDASTQAVLYYTTNASGNWTLNVRGSSTLTLNNMLPIGKSLTIAFLVTQGATPYNASSFMIDGGTITPKWAGGTAPTAGDANCINIYTYTIIKTGSAAYTALGSVGKYA
jgi:hypothetical protein